MALSLILIIRIRHFSPLLALILSIPVTHDLPRILSLLPLMRFIIRGAYLHKISYALIWERRLRPAFGVDRGAGLAAPGDRSRSVETISSADLAMGFAAHSQTFWARLGSVGCAGLGSAVGGGPGLVWPT